MAGNLNAYGDHRIPTRGHFGVDIAMQRADDLDRMALDRLKSIGSPARALDVASATGGQAIRMAATGAETTALDIDDYADAFMSAARQQGVAGRCVFERRDITGFNVARTLGRFDVIVCQRMIHYLPYQGAVAVIRNLASALTDDGRLYLSASGLHSELGDGYAGARRPVAMRYDPLADSMLVKHDIQGPVCLYSLADLATLLEVAGLRVEQVFASTFGNIKAVARPRP